MIRDDHRFLIMELWRHRDSISDFQATHGFGDDLPLSIFDLDYRKLRKVTKRQREAFFYHVILDLPTKEVGEIMGISAPSVTQYTLQAATKLAEDVWGNSESQR